MQLKVLVVADLVERGGPFGGEALGGTGPRLDLFAKLGEVGSCHLVSLGLGDRLEVPNGNLQVCIHDFRHPPRTWRIRRRP